MGFFCHVSAVFSQNTAPAYDSSFKNLYKAAALHPGYRNGAGIVSDSVVKRWDKDIVIYIEGGSSKNRKGIQEKLKNTIALITPALNNKIHIGFTDDKPSANYLIHLNDRGYTRWYIKWDGRFNIYNCIININTRADFNYEQQAGKVSHFLLQSLGDFVFNKKDLEMARNESSAASNISLWREDINSVDLQLLQVHYADGIRTGMTAREVDQFFAGQVR